MTAHERFHCKSRRVFIHSHLRFLVVRLPFQTADFSKHLSRNIPDESQFQLNIDVIVRRSNRTHTSCTHAVASSSRQRFNTRRWMDFSATSADESPSCGNRSSSITDFLQFFKLHAVISAWRNSASTDLPSSAAVPEVGDVTRREKSCRCKCTAYMYMAVIMPV